MGAPLSFWDFLFGPLEGCPTQAQKRPLPHIPRNLRFPEKERARHTLVYGVSGVGKTRLAEWLIGSDIYLRLSGRRKKGVLVVDAHGDLYDSIKARLSILAYKYPDLYELLVLLDATHPAWVARFNPLMPLPGQYPEDLAEALSDLITTLFDESAEVVVRMRKIARYTFLALILAGRPITEAGRFLSDEDYRDELLKGVSHTGLNHYFHRQFPTGDRERRAMTESVLNRLDRLIENPRIARMLTPPATVNFFDLMNRGAIMLLKAPKGVLGEGASKMLTGLVIGSVQNAALARQSIPERERLPLVIHADEYQNYITKSFTSILSESRKFAVELVAYTQTMRHISEELQGVMLQTVGNVLAFRVSRGDAEMLVREMFTPDLYQAKHIRVNYQSVHGTSARFEEPVFYTLPELWELEVRRLTQLPDRYYWWKHRGVEPSRLIKAPTVRDVVAIPGYHPGKMAYLLALQEYHARARYGGSHVTVEKPAPPADDNPDITGFSPRG